jgi:uncharacterized membrane protein
MKKRFLKLVFCALVCLNASVWAQVSFEIIPSPIGPTWSNYSLSSNGTVMAANYGGEIYRWTRSGGFVDLGTGDFLNSSIAISADGSTIVAGWPGPDGYSNPARWQQATGWVNLGHPAEGCVLDGSWGSGWSVNHDGSVVVGLAWYCPGAEGFQWTEQGGMVGLGHPTGASSRATAISADGSTTVGFYEDPRFGNRRPVRWVSGTTDLFLGANSNGEAIAVNSNGSQIVGQAVVDSSGYARAYSYTKAGLIKLGTLSGNSTDQSLANSVSDRGIVVGFSGDPFAGTSHAFVWGPKSGMRLLQRVLVQDGADIPAGLTITDALVISGDGSTIIGLWTDTNFNSGAFMARFNRKNSPLK